MIHIFSFSSLEQVPSWGIFQSLSQLIGYQPSFFLKQNQIRNHQDLLHMCVLSCSVVSDSWWPHGLQPAWLLCQWGFSRQEYWSGLPCPPPGNLPKPGSNPGLPQCRRILYHLSHQGSPRILESIACPFSRGSSQPRNWTGIPCIAGGFFISRATREVHIAHSKSKYYLSTILQ